MALALQTSSTDVSHRLNKLRVKATPSGNYSAGGDTVNLTTITNPKLLSGGRAGSLPTGARIVRYAAGYLAELILGATMQTCLLKIYSAPGVELAAGAYPAALAADFYEFELEGPKGSF